MHQHYSSWALGWHCVMHPLDTRWVKLITAVCPASSNVVVVFGTEKSYSHSFCLSEHLIFGLEKSILKEKELMPVDVFSPLNCLVEVSPAGLMTVATILLDSWLNAWDGLSSFQVSLHTFDVTKVIKVASQSLRSRGVNWCGAAELKMQLWVTWEVQVFIIEFFSFITQSFKLS